MFIKKPHSIFNQRASHFVGASSKVATAWLSTARKEANPAETAVNEAASDC